MQYVSTLPTLLTRRRIGTHIFFPDALHSTTTAAAEYEVESILEHQGTTIGDLEYLVKWVGYTGATWEPLVNLRGSSNELLGEYHAANGLRVYQWMGQG